MSAACFSSMISTTFRASWLLFSGASLLVDAKGSVFQYITISNRFGCIPDFTLDDLQFQLN